MTEKILITEDDASFLKAISHILEKEGYEVITASNGLEGLMKVQTNRPDMLILDVMLPGLDGFELCNRLRADPRTADLPILILSAKGQEADRVTGIKMGANKYISKPVDRTVLLDSVEELLSQQRSDRAL